MKTYDTQEAADYLKTSTTIIYELAGRGELRGAKIAKRWVFLEDDLVAYLRAQADAQISERLAERNIPRAIRVSPQLPGKV